MLEPERVTYGYRTFLEGIVTIVDKIQHSGYNPDYIVGIVRGGAVPAVYLSHRLGIPVQMLTWNTRDNALGNESNCWIPEDINAGKKILLVDDIVDGGDTIQQILADWDSAVREPLKYENIRTASLIYNTSQPVKVDYYHRAINRNEDKRWVVFDWEA